MEGILKRIRQASSMTPSNAQSLLVATIRDLNHTKGINKRFVASSRCMALYLECQLATLQAQNDTLWSTPGPLCANQGTRLRFLVEKMLMTSYRIEQTFHGLTAGQVLSLHELRIIAHSLQILATERCDTSTEKNLGSTLQVWQSFLARVKHYTKLLSTSGIKLDSFGQALMSFQDFFEANITKPLFITEHLQSIVLERRMSHIELDTRIKEASATMTEPQGGSENPLTFTSGLTLGINVDALIENIGDPSCVQIQVSI